MKLVFVALFSLITGFLNAQNFEIPAGVSPYYEVVEWKGFGAILLDRDPTFNQKQVHMTLVAGEGKSSWNQDFSPGGKEYFYISEDGGKYAYFLEHLELKSGGIRFHQLTSGGNIRSNSVSFSTALKKLGNYPAEELELLDIVTTEKSLVYLFTHTNNAAKKKTTIAVSMTHNNFLVYATLIAENVTGSPKVEDLVSWYIAGEAGESLVFAARVHAGKNAGWAVKQFSPKGELESEKTVLSAGLTFLDHERTGFGTRGSAYLNRVQPKEQGTLLVSGGNYYVGGVEANGMAFSLATYSWSGDKWNKITASPVKSYNTKKPVLQVGYFPLKEGIGWYVKTAAAEGHFHSFTNSTGIVSGSVSQQINNPSRLLTAEYSGKFVAALPDKWLVFDPKQLPGKSNVTFEYMQK